MVVLLDTYVFIWFLNGDNQLPLFTKNIIADNSNKCFLSIASIWEMAIKISLGKLELQGSFDDIERFLDDNNIEILPVTFKYLQRLQHLDFHHRDPFDRMIIAQALSENLFVATRDSVFHNYGVSVVWSNNAA